jgi:hypothetical protein
LNVSTLALPHPPEGALITESAAAAAPLPVAAASPPPLDTLGTCSSRGSTAPDPAAAAAADGPSIHHAAAGRFFLGLGVCS